MCGSRARRNLAPGWRWSLWGLGTGADLWVLDTAAHAKQLCLHSGSCKRFSSVEHGGTLKGSAVLGDNSLDRI